MRYIRALFVLVCLCAVFSAAAVPSRAQTTLVLWHTWQPPQAALLEEWLADYPPLQAGDLTLEVIYVPHSQLSALLDNPPNARPPDLILSTSDALAQPAVRRFAAVLDRTLTPEFRQTLTPLAWQLAQFNGQVQALPLALESYTLYYNRALVDEGLPNTVRDLAAQAAEVGLILPRDFYPTAGMFFALNGSLLDENANSALSTNALGNYLIALRGLAGAQGVQLGAAEDGFRQGAVGYLLGGSWRLPVLRAALGDDLGVAALPSVEGRPWLPVARAWQLYIGVGSPFREANLALARHLLSADAQRRVGQYGFLPTLPAAADSTPLLMPLARAIYESGVPLPNRPELAALWLPLREAINAVLEEGRDPLTAASQAVQRAAEGVAAIRTQ